MSTTLNETDVHRSAIEGAGTAKGEATAHGYGRENHLGDVVVVVVGSPCDGCEHDQRTCRETCHDHPDGRPCDTSGATAHPSCHGVGVCVRHPFYPYPAGAVSASRPVACREGVAKRA